MRTIPSNALTVLAQNQGTEPINILDISWTGTTYTSYADKDIPPNALGKILEISGLDNTIDLLNGTTTGSISITLDDTDDTIRQIINQYDIHKRPCRLYQYFPSLVYSDRFLVFSGYIVSPIVWSEGERTLKFEILSGLYARDVGFTPEQGQFNFVPIELIGNVWPLGFGSCIHQPAVRYEQTLKGATSQVFMLPDQTLSLKLWLLQFGVNNLQSSFSYYQQVMNMTAAMVDDPAVIQNDYIANILTEDRTRQLRENVCDIVMGLNNNIKMLYDLYNEDSIANVAKLAQAQVVIKTRDIQLNIIKGYSDKLREVEYNKKLDERNVKNAKYKYNVIGKLRAVLAKLMGQFTTITNQINEVTLLIQGQASLAFTKVPVTNGYRFPQGVQQDIQIGQQVFGGSFSGNTFTFSSAKPTYRNVLIGPKIDTALNTFFVTDINLALGGQYAYTNKGIIKITSQTQLKCEFELKEIPQSLRTLRKRYQNNPERFDIIRGQLGNSLTGNETEDQLDALAGSFPTDINQSAWMRLASNGYNQQTITAKNVTGGTFDLYLDGFVLRDLPWNATVAQVKQAIVELSIFAYGQFDYNKGDTATILANISVTGGPISVADMVVTFGGPLLPMKPMRADGNNLTTIPATQNISTIGSPTSGYSTITASINNPGMAVGFTTRGEQTRWYDIYNEIKIAFNEKSFYRDPNGKDYDFGIFGGSLDQAISNFIQAIQGIRVQGISYLVGPYSDSSLINKSLYNIVDDSQYTNGPIQSIIFGVGKILGTPTTSSVTFKINTGDSASLVKTKIVNFTPYTDKDFITTGGPIGTDDVVITWKNRNPNISFTVTDNSTLIPTNSAILFGEVYSPATAVIGIYTNTTGAHQHTLNEITKMLAKVNRKSQFGTALEETKKNLINLVNQIGQAGNADDQATMDQILKYQKEFRNINSMIKMPQSVLVEANRMISDKEYNVLYDLECLNYVSMIRSLIPISEQTPDKYADYFFTGRDIFVLFEVAATILPNWLAPINQQIGIATTATDAEAEEAEHKAVTMLQQLPSSSAFFAQVGTPVSQFGIGYDQYVVNQAPSTIKAVYAYRNIGGVRYLVPVPSSYYSKNENNNFGLFHATTIQLYHPLDYYKEESWEDGLYVTYQSSISNNTSDIIKYIYQNYTDAAIDSTSFASVKTALTNYPMNFAITSSKNALTAVKEIAWQARCSTFIKDGTAYIEYLATQPASVDTITESDILENSLYVTTDSTEDLVTKFTALWKPNGSIQDNYKLILRHNVALYKEIAQDYSFYCYNIFSLVEKSATYWQIRKSHIWKKIQFKTAIHKLNLETYDFITLNLQNNLFCTGSTLAMVERAEYDSATNTIAFTCWTPIVFGTMVPYTYSWPADLSETVIYPLVNEIITGNAGNPLGIQVPTGLNFDPLSLATTTIRPHDWGSVHPSDKIDTLPQDPTNEFQEVDYTTNVDTSFDVVGLEDITDTTLTELYAGAEDDGKTKEEQMEGQGDEGIVKGGTYIGRISGPPTAVSSPAPLGAEPTQTIARMQYPVTLFDGTVINAEAINVDPRDTLPDRMIVSVIYEETHAQYFLVLAPSFILGEVPIS